MGNREERAGLAMWKRFQKTAEMTFWGDKPNGSGLKRRRRRFRARIVLPSEGRGRTLFHLITEVTYLHKVDKKFPKPNIHGCFIH